jgi:DNA-binding PadR family transcriptional regulator
MVGKSQSYKGNRISPLQFVMLLMLREKPMYGYELLKTLREEFEGVWTPQTGSVYPALKRLEDHGLVHSTVKDGTEYYALAREGEDFVAEGTTEIPGDMQFMIRYFQILDRAASGQRGQSLERPEHAFSRMFDQERVSTEDRLKMLHSARETLMSRLAIVQTELEELEKKVRTEKGDQ